MCTMPFTVFAYNIISNPISFGLLRDQTAARGVIDCCLSCGAAVPLGRVFVEETFKTKCAKKKNGRTCHNYILKIRFCYKDNGLPAQW